MTEFPIPLLSVIKIANDLVEIDLVNSQYALLAFALQDENINILDALAFCEHAGAGTLYEYMMGLMGKSREEVKDVMMRVCFSKDQGHVDT